MPKFTDFKRYYKSTYSISLSSPYSILLWCCVFLAFWRGIENRGAFLSLSSRTIIGSLELPH